eukprot:GHVS01030551.1.p3 GENE.GHVS01030551.1~~GHVS01030551.1.p3  ORF type:complete len:133 (+),score=34.54 GHVS01030551.1:588-986(+)
MFCSPCSLLRAMLVSSSSCSHEEDLLPPEILLPPASVSAAVLVKDARCSPNSYSSAMLLSSGGMRETGKRGRAGAEQNKEVEEQEGMVIVRCRERAMSSWGVIEVKGRYRSPEVQSAVWLCLSRGIGDGCLE